MLPTYTKYRFKLVLIGLFTMFLAACSGSGDPIDEGEGDGGTTTDNYNLVASLADSSGTSSSTIAEGTGLTVSAILTNNGEVVNGQTVNFSISNGSLAALSSTSAVTDSEGVATVNMTGLATAGDGSITVSVANTSITAGDVVLTFRSEGKDTVRTGVYNHDVFLVPAETTYEQYSTITASTLTTISQSQAATLLIKYTEEDGTPIPNSLVALELVDDASQIATLSNDLGKDLTDANGFAFFKVNATDLSGAGYLKVIFDDGVESLTTFKSIGKGTSGEAANYSLLVSMVNDNGEVVSSVSSGASIEVNAVLTNNGVAVAGEVVTFTTTNSDFATLSGTSITTDAQGIASVTLTGTANAGTGTITIDVPEPSIEVNKVNLGFTSLGVVNAGSDEFIYQAYLVPSNTEYEAYPSVSESSLTTISSNQPGTILVRYSQADGTPVANSVVAVTLVGDAVRLGTLSNDLGTSLTDTNGFAAINIIATDVSGAGYIQIAYSDGTTSLLPFQSQGDGGAEPVKEIGSIELLASNLQLASSGSDEVELLALVKDGQNNLMEGIQVSFSSNSGDIRVLEPSTAANGVAKAVLSTLGNPETRTITATAFVGDKSATVNIDVAGTTIKIVGNNSIVTGDTVEMTVVMLDSDGIGIDGSDIIISSQAGNSFTKTDGSALNQMTNDDGTISQYVTTDLTGSARFNLSAEKPDSDKLTASALGESGELAISISPDSFEISDLQVMVDGTLTANNSNNEVPLSGGQLTLTWQKDETPHVGEVLFSATRGTINTVQCDDDTTATSTTDVNGQICVSLSSTDAGPAIVTAKADGLAASYNVEFIAEEAHLMHVQASPFSIGPNGQKSTISAVVVDDLGNFVKNKVVNFTLYDVSNGSISRQSDITDSNGLATTVYTSNGISALDGVVVAACTDVTTNSGDCINVLFDQADEDRSNDYYHCEESDSCIHDEVKITVADRELFITVGTGNTVGSANDQEYEKSFSIMVTDVESNPIEGVELSVSAVPESYNEGEWVVKLNDEGEFDKYVPLVTGVCQNEDIDRDGVLDRVEDIDRDGKWDTVNEDLDHDGRLDIVDEDLDSDRILDVNEDLDNDGNLDVDEDIDGDNNFDLFYEYVGGVCSLDDPQNIDLNNDNTLDVGENVNCSNLPTDPEQGEDIDKDDELDLTEDLDGDGRFDRINEDVDGDDKLDTVNEDLDNDGYLDTFPDFIGGEFGRDLNGNKMLEPNEIGIMEDVDGDGNLDVIEYDYNHDGVVDANGINEDKNQNNILEPGNVVTVLGSLVTDENGATTVSLRYAESYGAWVTLNLVVKAKVGGTEYMQVVPLTLPYSAADVTNEDSPPTGNLFGADGNCATVN